MASVSSITLSGHVESTIYHRAGREWISLDGKEIGVYEYCPGSSPTPLKVVQFNELYYSVHAVPRTGVYTGIDIMERISHDISVFWTKLSSVIDQVSPIAEFDVNTLFELSNIMVDLAHTCGAEIEQEQSKSRSYLLEAESSSYETSQLNQELLACSAAVDQLQKKSHTFSKALKCSLNTSNDSSPLLHQLCQDKSVSVTEIVKELQLDIHQQASIPSLKEKIMSFSGVEFAPIQVASLCGNTSAMQELYEMDPTVVYSLTGSRKLSVLELSAFGSLECFELCKNWLPASSLPLRFDDLFGAQKTLLEMAARGGNSNLLRALIPSPQSFSVSAHAKVWSELVLCACFGGDKGSLDWLMEFNGSKALLDKNLCTIALVSHGTSFSLPCVQWLVENGLSPKLLRDFEPQLQNFQHKLARSGRYDVLEWMSKNIKGFKLAGPSENCDTLFHSACESKDSLKVMKWALGCSAEHLETLNIDGEHAVHAAAKYGRLECLQWIWKQRGTLKNPLSIYDCRKRTVAHYAAMSGSVTTMKWLFEADKAVLLHTDADGCLPIHHAYGSLEMLKWMVDVGKCDLEARNKEGWQVLHFAVIENAIDVVTFIISRLDVTCLQTPIPQTRQTATDLITTPQMADCIWKLCANLSYSKQKAQVLFSQRTEIRRYLTSIAAK